MKKAIIYLGLALLAFSNVTMASANTTAVPEFGLVKEYGNNTPLAIAIMKGDTETVKKFIEYGADVNEKSNGMTPLMVAARYNRVDIIKLLLDKGANLKAADEKGLTALKHAQISKASDAEELIKQALDS
ncbi:ankyrin [Flavobacterium akiainvivens]|uniref:Ankyrin n=1 Tax=Flavobacterium akiainvivens TaxID=1202724 RepID=A0A0M9VGX0_9FLAO|nr:ankyrin repeat domain-containing protein [Flavobacterium akiainvivens]KOS04939.1 ankyrin [Flavobacterium akiainvivens]SFQ41772.1 Ankyrin repeat-containing protein [Flavobacterium akiainvivens]